METTTFDSYQLVTDTCIRAFCDESPIDPLELATRIMSHPEFPMHYPSHHYLVPAVLLTTVLKDQNETLENFKSDLETIHTRSLNVLGGFCGFYGACGAAVGLGIFMSVLTGTTPHTESTWAVTNRITGGALIKMSEIDGPRCCKRNTFIALKHAVSFLKEEMKITIPLSEDIHCTFSESNSDCKHRACPFYKG